MCPNSGKTYSREFLQEALRQTALAFYNKAIDVQYCAKQLTIQERFCTRLCCGSSPEMAAIDTPHYAVCSAYQFDIYKNAFDYALLGGINCGTPCMVALPATDPIVKVKYGGEDGMTDLSAALKAARECLQVGDLLVGYRSSGHVMMFIGDYKGDGKDYLIHCWGKSYNPETGEDMIEGAGHFPTTHPKGGAIRIDEVDSFCFDPADKKSYFANKCDTFVILRPLDDPSVEFIPTAATLARMQYRGIEIRREASLLRYNTAFTGDELTITVAVTNNGEADYPTMTVTDPVPEGTELIAGKNDTFAVRDGVLSWKIQVKAGETVSVSYRVRVTAGAGERIIFTAGAVDVIPTRHWEMRVGRKPLEAEQLARCAKLVRSGVPQIAEKDAAFAKKMYELLFGVKLALPDTLAEMVPALCKVIPVFASAWRDGTMLTPKADGELDALGKKLRSMLIPEHLLGHYIYIGEHPEQEPTDRVARDRVRVYREPYYEVGDIFLASVDPESFVPTSSDKVLVYIYLGNGKVLSCDSARGALVQPFEETVGYLLNKRIVLGLRPTLK